MNLANKSFRDNKTGEIVKVIDSFDNIAVLENKQRVDVRKLTDPNLFTEQIDVNSFFNTQGAYNSLAEKIKNIPMENIVDDGGARSVVIADGIRLPSSEESAVIMSSEDEEKAELARKYGVNISNESVQNQNAAFAKILGSDEDLPRVERKTEVIVNGQPDTQVSKTYHPPVSQNDPITNMFKNVKRNVSFKMSLEISNKIPRLDFIEMMEDSYEVSIIDYLAEEFTQNLLKDPSQIKEMIKDRIKKVVYGVEVKTEKIEEPESKKLVKKPVAKKPAVKSPKKEEAK